MNVEPATHKWEFQARFRRHAFGWRSRPAILRIKQAVSEIKKAVRRDPVLAADGAVLLLERISPALENVDSSSGAIGTVVNNAIAQLVPIIIDAPADATTRERWLERLWEAYQADEMPYIEQLGDYWGELCASKELAAAWANRLLGITRLALSPDKSVRGFFCGTSACLSALYRAERYQEIVELVGEKEIWSYKSWAVKALAAAGKKSEAIRCAEASRGSWTSDSAVDRLCEEIVLYRAERYQEIVELVGEQEIWPYKSWAVKALVGMGKKSEVSTLRPAIESCRDVSGDVPGRGPQVPAQIAQRDPARSGADDPW